MRHMTIQLKQEGGPVFSEIIEPIAGLTLCRYVIGTRIRSPMLTQD